MIGKKVKLRITFLFLLLITATLIIFLAFNSLKENVVYFKSPSDVKYLPEITKKK